MEQRIIELEKRLTFQAHMIEELNAELILQQKRIGLLEKQLKSVMDQVRSGGGVVKDLQDEEPPPHY